MREKVANLFEFIDIYTRGLSPTLSKSTTDKNARCIAALREMVGADAPDPDLRVAMTDAFQQRFARFLATKPAPLAPATIDETLGDLRKFLRKAIAMRVVPDIYGEKTAPDYRAPFDTLLGIIAKWVGNRPFATPAADPAEYRRQREYDLNLRCAILYAFSICCYGISLRDIITLRASDLDGDRIRIPSLDLWLPLATEANRLRYAFNGCYAPATPDAPLFNLLPAGATETEIDKKAASLRRRILRFLKSKNLPLLQGVDLSDDWLSLAVQSGLSSEAAYELLAASLSAKIFEQSKAGLGPAEQSCLRQQCKAVPAVQSPSGRAKLSISSAEQSCFAAEQSCPPASSPASQGRGAASSQDSPEEATYFSPGCQPWGQESKAKNVGEAPQCSTGSQSRHDALLTTNYKLQTTTSDAAPISYNLYSLPSGDSPSPSTLYSLPSAERPSPSPAAPPRPCASRAPESTAVGEAAPLLYTLYSLLSGDSPSPSTLYSQLSTLFREANAGILASRNPFSEDWHMLRIFATRLNSSKLKKHLVTSGLFGPDRDAAKKIYDPVDVLADPKAPNPLSRFLFFKSTPYTTSLVNGLSRDAAVLRSRTDRRFVAISAAELKVMQEALRDFRDDVQLVDRDQWLRENADRFTVGGKVRILDGPLRGREATILEVKGNGPETRTYLLEFAQGNITAKTTLSGLALEVVSL